MDLQLVTLENTWDIAVTAGIPATVTGDNELTQRAMVAAFIQKNTIPLLPDLGNDWTKYLTGEISLSEIDAQVRSSINLLMDRLDFVPFYSIDNNRAAFTISKVQLAGVQ